MVHIWMQQQQHLHVHLHHLRTTSTSPPDPSVCVGLQTLCRRETCTCLRLAGSASVPNSIPAAAPSPNPHPPSPLSILRQRHSLSILTINKTRLPSAASTYRREIDMVQSRISGGRIFSQCRQQRSVYDHNKVDMPGTTKFFLFKTKKPTRANHFILGS
ncbi:uncharacterized protein LOC120458176 [Drosophila santomea]|uniref:uncharacterized protein LOC120458176 n=1 Tax=Drosophila santomea TaxID=129105 RepID=UPI001953E5D2|nr:uncharacterized protein LOC120458176 [Drosophila santomea]